MKQDYVNGNISIVLPEHIKISDQAGKLTPEEVKRIANPRKGIGLLCEQLAEIMDKNPEFVVPGVTSDGLRQAGDKADDIDLIILELENTLKIFKQQNLLFDSAAYELVRRVNDQVTTQSKYNAQLKDIFAPVVQYFSRVKKSEPKSEV